MYLLISLLKKYMIVTTIADMAQCYALVDKVIKEIYDCYYYC